MKPKSKKGGSGKGAFGKMDAKERSHIKNFGGLHPINDVE